MKIQFQDTSFIDFSVNEKDEISIILCAKDWKHPNTRIVNTVEISKKEFMEVVESLGMISPQEVVEAVEKEG